MLRHNCQQDSHARLYSYDGSLRICNIHRHVWLCKISHQIFYHSVFVLDVAVLQQSWGKTEMRQLSQTPTLLKTREWRAKNNQNRREFFEFRLQPQYMCIPNHKMKRDKTSLNTVSCWCEISSQLASHPFKAIPRQCPPLLQGNVLLAGWYPPAHYLLICLSVNRGMRK